MTQPQLSAEETARRGDEIYDRQIREAVEAENPGKIVAIDVETGDYVLAETAINAARRLRLQQPNAEVWFVRVGSPALHHIGARPLVTSR